MEILTLFLILKGLMNEGILAKIGALVPTASCGHYINSSLFFVLISLSLLPLSISPSHLSFHLFAPDVCLNLSRISAGRKMWMLRGEVKIFSANWPQSSKENTFFQTDRPSPHQVWRSVFGVVFCPHISAVRPQDVRSSMDAGRLFDAAANPVLPLSPHRCLGTGPLGLLSLLCWCSPLRSRYISLYCIA